MGLKTREESALQPQQWLCGETLVKSLQKGLHGGYPLAHRSDEGDRSYPAIKFLRGSWNTLFDPGNFEWGNPHRTAS